MKVKCKFVRRRTPEDNKRLKNQVKRFVKKKTESYEKEEVQEDNYLHKITDTDLKILLKELAERKLIEFVRQAWHVLEPDTAFVDGWHLHAICEHLEAVYEGKISRLLINIPPRCMKSLAVAVFFPCWIWTRKPEKRMLFSSYSSDLSERDGDKCATLINSNWYKENWGDKFSLVKETSNKIENDKKGYRIATSVGGMTTGEGGDLIVVDDPHNAKEIGSEIKRLAVLRWWDEAMSTRLNDQRTGAKIIVMQRLHEKDLSGHVLAKDNSYVHLCLPARYEVNAERTRTPLGFKDPRSKEGEILWAEKITDEEMKCLESDLGEYARAGQLQQRPSPRGGGLFKVANFVKRTVVDYNEVVRSVRYWDKAGTADGGCFTCGVLMFLMKDGSFFINDIIAGQWNATDRERHIVSTVKKDSYHAKTKKYQYCSWTEQEPGSSGKESAQATIKRLAGYRMYADRVTGDKESRATDFAVQVEAGNVYVLDTDWTDLYFTRMEFYPLGEYKDWGDASSGAFNKLVNNKKAGTWGRRRENAESQKVAKVYAT